MPISNSTMYNRLSDNLNLGTSGQVSQDEYNRATAQVELELLDILLPFLEMNERAAMALSEATVVLAAANTSSTGLYAYPTGYYHGVSAIYIAGGVNYPVEKMRHMSVGPSNQNGLRNKTVASNRVGYVPTSTGLQFYPQSTLSIQLTYIKKPTAAAIVLTPTVTPDEDYVTVGGGTTDFQWHESVTNLMFYMILEKLGVQLKEQLQVEFASFGIERGSVKTIPNPVTE